MSEYRNLTRIEHLPNELFLQIFQHINARDLHRGWAKLNKRFRAILRSIPMHAYLIEKNDYKDYKACFRYYPSQFHYIRIEQNCDLPETFDVSLFSNIRSLHLGIVTSDQYDQITPKNMPYLIYLTINELQTHRNPISLLFGSNQFIHIKTCQLPYFFSTTIPIQFCLTLRSLHLNFCSPDVFFDQVKLCLPNLVYFESVFGSNSTNMDTIRNKQSMMIPHTILRHLKIELLKYTSSDLLPRLLSVVPELHCLELICRYYCDYRQLADILETNLLQLKQLYLVVNESQYQSLPEVDILKPLSPWFTQMKVEQYGENNRIICDGKKLE